MLSIKEIKKMDNEVITIEQMEELEESEFVTDVENCGGSGYYVGKQLYCVTLVDETTIDVCI